MGSVDEKFMRSARFILSCNFCVMKNIEDPDLVIDQDGKCNHCHRAEALANQHRVDQQNLPWVIDDIKKRGRGRKYDVVLGMSGGADSSYALHVLNQHNVRVFAFHFDNGYNEPQADANVMKLVEATKTPLFRYTIDREKFRELYEAFIRGGVKNLEAITDHLLFAINYEMANREGVRTCVTGGNWQTESIMPKEFGEDPRDLRWIRGVYRTVTGKRLQGLPVIPLWREQYYRLVKRIKFVPILDFVDYNRQHATERLGQLYSYEYVGAKHEESRLTKWFQGFYLPQRWVLDKRRPHLSSMIHSGQITRDEALRKLALPLEYPTLGWEEWNYPKRTYSDYPNSERGRRLVMKLYACAKKCHASL